MGWMRDQPQRLRSLTDTGTIPREIIVLDFRPLTASCFKEVIPFALRILHLQTISEILRRCRLVTRARTPHRFQDSVRISSVTVSILHPGGTSSILSTKYII